MSEGQLLGIRKSSAFFYARSDACGRGNAFAVSGGKGNARYVSVKPAGRQVESLYRRIVYGAMGTYDMVSRFPDIFAAAVPICGTVNPTRLSTAGNVAFRIFHGDADDVVPVVGSRTAYKALKAANASVEYIEFPGCNHGSWNPAFNCPDFMSWLFGQRKKK